MHGCTVHAEKSTKSAKTKKTKKRKRITQETQSKLHLRRMCDSLIEVKIQLLKKCANWFFNIKLR